MLTVICVVVVDLLQSHYLSLSQQSAASLWNGACYGANFQTTACNMHCRGVTAPGSQTEVWHCLGQLQPYLTACLSSLGLAIAQHAISDINNWLVGLHLHIACM